MVALKKLPFKNLVYETDLHSIYISVSYHIRICSKEIKSRANFPRLPHLPGNGSNSFGELYDGFAGE